MTKRKQDEQPVLLLIDDAPEIHRLLAVKLKDEGLEFLAAFSGTEGIELAESQLPSLILLDINIPDFDGFELLHRLKADPKTKEIPVIVVSGSSDSEAKVRAFGIGAMDYVTKPFDVPELRARIQSAIRITRLLGLLEERAQIDGLTGLWNRHYFNKRLESEISETSRKGTPLSLVMCDLDHFKKLNDTFGHPAGDAVLQAFASTLQEELRAYDIPCRYGGEEFSIIFPGTSVEEAAAVCERIRKALEARIWRKYPEMRATGSFGVTDHPSESGQDAHAWIEAADQALYAAKTSGRNRIHIADATENSIRLAV
ncbi:MAG: diguanylate cyclase [Planctomycetota bacterium]